MPDNWWEQVDTNLNLGLFITDDSEGRKEIPSIGLLAKGHCVAAALKKVRKSRNILLATKIRLVGILMWRVAMYGSQSWTIKKAKEAIINPVIQGVERHKQIERNCPWCD